MKEKDRFLNFPIVLLQGFLDDHKKCLFNICCFAVYKMIYSEESNFENLEEFKEEFQISVPLQLGNSIQKHGKELFDSCNGMGYPWTGIHIDTFMAFNKDREEFDLVCLLLFLALKTIIQVKPYANAKDAAILSRMAGYGKSGNSIPERIQYWMDQKNRRRKKIFAELEKHYKVVKAYKARGTTFSINKLNQVELELAILEKKDEQARKESTEKKKLAKEEALKIFNLERRKNNKS